jgi:hypothetical protein
MRANVPEVARTEATSSLASTGWCFGAGSNARPMAQMLHIPVTVARVVCI